MDLREYRERIDEIDDALLRLFTERMDVSREIALYKNERGLPVYDAAREAEKLGAINGKARADMRPYAAELYRALSALSRAYQKSLTEAKYSNDVLEHTDGADGA